MPRCPGCKANFKSLASHTPSCNELLDALQNGRELKRKHQEAQRLEKMKQQKIEEARVAEERAREEAAAEERVRREAELEASQLIVVKSFSRARRQRRIPGRIRDMVPTSLAGLPEHLPRPPPRLRNTDPSGHAAGGRAQGIEASSETSSGAEPDTPPFTETTPNEFDVFRRYSQSPLHDPEEDLSLDSFINPTSLIRSSQPQPSNGPLRPFGSSILSRIKENISDIIPPFANITVFRLMHWLHSGSVVKSASELTRLVRDVFLPGDYSRDHILDFDANRENARLDEYAATTSAFSADDGWRRGSVSIPLPKERCTHASETAAPRLQVTDIFYRPFVEVIKAAYQDPAAYRFHWFPFQFLWRHSPASAPERLYTDVYNSDAMLEEHEKICTKALHNREDGDDPKLEYAVVPISVYSDSTHLTSFGTASLWPIYAFFASISKYFRARPTSFSAHHLAYIPSLPLTIQTKYEQAYGEPASAAVLRFCKRELMQAVWLLLLDDDFVKAYQHGMVVVCGDGITRRLFPRIFIYSADYPEKCLIACIKHLARCLCPDCLVEKEKVASMGTINDLKWRESHPRSDTAPLRHNISTARKMIFEQGAPVEGAHVEGLLGAHSTTPIRSAFSTSLAEYGFDLYRMLVPDLMHEFELGVWKATFTHLIRILVAAGGRAVQELDARFAQIPTFGRDTIRRFGDNVSAMKKLAARDFEDLVQCAIPAFEGLLDAPHDKVVLDLLFILATWHALAKLRLHTESTLTVFEQWTRSLGETMRVFVRKVCPSFATRELPKETMARHRRTAAASAKGKQPATSRSKTSRGAAVGQSKPKLLNLQTYKYHRLGDYPRTIRLLGPTDNYTTQVGELEHRRVKRFYARTNKNATFVGQITRQQRREAILHHLNQRTESAATAHAIKKGKAAVQPRHSNPQSSLRLAFAHSEPLGLTPPTVHTHISQDQRHYVDLYAFTGENRDDPFCRDFVINLKKHILTRLDGVLPTDDIDPLRIRQNRLYIHKVMRVNYTSYDMRRDQDTINPRSHPDVMMLAPSGENHPYLYARVLSIFHVNAYHLDSVDQKPQSIPILWVRWLDVDHSAPGGFATKRPHRLYFAAPDNEPYGFLAPDQVLRGVHLIPAFHHGRSDNGFHGQSPARHDGQEDDWKFFYIGMWSDRDLFMRYLGGAVGHKQGSMAVSPFGPDINANTDDSSPSEDICDLGDAMNASDDEESDRSCSAAEEDGSASEGDTEDFEQEESGDEPDLGPDDGETDQIDADEYEAAGFAPL